HTLKLITVSFMLVTVLLAARVMHLSPPVFTAVMLLAGSYAINAFVENQAAYFIGREQMHQWTIASGIFGLVSGSAGIAVVTRTHSLVAFAAAPLLGQSAAFAWLAYRSPAPVRSAVGTSKLPTMRLGRALLPFAAAFIGTTIFYRTDFLLLSQMRTAHDVGLYGAASKILDVTQALAIACAGALLPRLSRMRADG